MNGERINKIRWAILLLGLAAIAILLLTGCPRQIIKEKHTVTVRDTTIYLPGASVEKTINIERLIAAPADTQLLHLIDSTGRVSAELYKDLYNQIRLRATCNPETLTLPGAIRTEYIDRTIPVPGDCKPPAVAWWGWLLIGLLVGAVVWLVLKIFVR